MSVLEWFIEKKTILEKSAGFQSLCKCENCPTINWIYISSISQNVFRETHFFHKDNWELNWNIKFIDLEKSAISSLFGVILRVLVLYRFNCTDLTVQI